MGATEWARRGRPQAMLSVGECRRVACVSFGAPCFALSALSEAINVDPRTRDMFHVFCNEHDVVTSILSHPVQCHSATPPPPFPPSPPL